MTKTTIIKKEYKIEQGADLRYADLRDADLRDADLRKVNIGNTLQQGKYYLLSFDNVLYNKNTKFDEGSDLDLYIKNQGRSWRK